MDKLNDFLKNIMDRFSNPLIFSFICSWVIINWQITVGLLWYDSELIGKTGNESLFTFINSKLNWHDSFCNPLWIALGYTFLMPIIKIVIQAFNTKMSKIGEEWNLKILKGGKIGIDKFLRLREDHKQRTEILERVISEESDYINKYNKVNTELLQTQNKLNQTFSQLNDKQSVIDNYTNIGVLSGTWVNNFVLSNGSAGQETIYINKEEYYIISTFGTRVHKFDIKNFFYDKGNNEVFFIKELTQTEKAKRPPTEHFLINRLRFNGSDILTGTENNLTKIEYTRK